MITFVLAVCGNVDYIYTFPLSPPSRAAWIEIFLLLGSAVKRERRRLHGRRGLKYDAVSGCFAVGVSPPSRAAWIEISGDSGMSASAGASPPSRAAWIEIR